MLRQAAECKGTVLPAGDDQLQYTRLEPVGVVGAILPWDPPLMSAGLKVPAALAAGTAVVLKPAEDAPLTTLWMTETWSGFLLALSLAGLSPWALVRAGVAHAPQGRRCFRALTARENLRMGCYVAPQLFHDQMEELLDAFPELKTKLADLASSLRGGQQQMLAVARALMSQPRILLLDEPSLGLSPMYVERVATLLPDLQQNRDVTILIAEQNLLLVTATSQRSYFMRTGRIVLDVGNIDDLTNDSLARIYLSTSDQEGA